MYGSISRWRINAPRRVALPIKIATASSISLISPLLLARTNSMSSAYRPWSIITPRYNASPRENFKASNALWREHAARRHHNMVALRIANISKRWNDAIISPRASHIKNAACRVISPLYNAKNIICSKVGHVTHQIWHITLS